MRGRQNVSPHEEIDSGKRDRAGLEFGKEVPRMSASSKRQTMAKVTRERALKERRALKQEKKDDRKRAADTLRAEAESGLSAPTVDVTPE